MSDCDGDELVRRQRRESTVGAYVPPAAPVTMTITAEYVPAASQIALPWSAVSGAQRYVVTRRARASQSGTSFEVSAPAVQYGDTNIIADAFYVYDVVAYNASGAEIGRSPSRFITAVAFTDLSSAAVAAAHFNELLRGLNAVRSYVGWSTVTWSNILAPTDALVAPGVAISAKHLTSLRLRINEALQAAGFAIDGYADPDVLGKAIRLTHITDLRSRLK